MVRVSSLLRTLKLAILEFSNKKTIVFSMYLRKTRVFNATNIGINPDMSTKKVHISGKIQRMRENNDGGTGVQ